MITWKAKMAKRLKVEEYDHAYLVVGTASIEKARRALWIHLGKKKGAAIKRMPVRPFHHEIKGSCVAMYFAIGPGAEKVYKP